MPDIPTIGGSSIGAICGLNRYTTPLDVYRRLIDGDTVADNPNMARGRVLEDIAVAELEGQIGIGRARRCDPSRHTRADMPYAHATPDRWLLDPYGENVEGIIEVKCPTRASYLRTLTHGLDPSYYAQLQWYLDVCDLPRGLFAIFCADAWELHVIPVEADRAMQDRLREAGEQFWRQHLVRRIPPMRSWISEASPTVEEIAARIPGSATVRNDPAWRVAFTRWQQTTAARKAAEKADDEAKAVCLAALGNVIGTIITDGIGKVTVSERATRTFDAKRFALEHQDLDLEPYHTTKVSSVVRPTFEENA